MDRQGDHFGRMAARTRVAQQPVVTLCEAQECA
jgi:hypothetical protein